MSSLVVPGRYRSKIFQPIDATFHHLAGFISLCVEFRGATTPAALLQTRFTRVFPFGTNTDNLATAELLTILLRPIGTVHPQDRRSLPRAARSGPPYSHLVKQGEDIGGIAGLPRRDEHRQGAALPITQNVDFTVSSSSTDSEPLVFENPLFSSRAGRLRAPTAARWALQLVLSTDAPSQSMFP